MKSLTLTCSATVLVALVVILQLQVPQAQADSFSCAGSALCRGLAQSDCDAARRQIQPNNRYFTGGNKGSTGVCSGRCGLFVSGSNCDLTGNEMITAFNELRSQNCQKCGVKTYNDGCKFKADYILALSPTAYHLAGQSNSQAEVSLLELSGQRAKNAANISLWTKNAANEAAQVSLQIGGLTSSTSSEDT
ncbi:hypothetical protein AgCh_040245 [Apium graveolens]